MNTISTPDASTRFLFGDADIRGEIVQLSDAYSALLGDHGYPASVAALLGEFAVAAILISNNLKYRGRIILQARSEGALSLVMVECSSEGHIRGIARGDACQQSAAPETDAPASLSLLAGGQLALTIEREAGQRYQGIVALDGESLAAALNSYFHQSEQLHTQFFLATGDGRAAGMMLQQLPPQVAQAAEHRSAQWEHAAVLANTLNPDELLQLAPETLLYRLYHEESLKLFPPEPVIYHCRCTRERSLDALGLLPVEELELAFTDEGVITMTCDMCGTVYNFARGDIPALAEGRVLH